MRVIEINKSTIGQLACKKLCIVELSTAYLEEFYTVDDVFANIECLIDENIRKIGDYCYKNKRFIIFPLSHLKNMDFDIVSIVITSDYYKEYIEKIKVLFNNKPPFSEVYVYHNYETMVELKYRKQYVNHTLENIIIFRSGPTVSEYVEGMDFSDNARALFNYMLDCGLNKDYELIWYVKNPADFYKYDYLDNVMFLPYEGSTAVNSKIRDAYYRALCLAKYIFFTDAYGFARNCRNDQVRVQLWHGCGFKSRLNHVPCLNRYEYMPVTSTWYAGAQAKEFGLNNDQMLVTGLPKEDLLFRNQYNIFELINVLPANKYFMWLPTYRFSEADKNKPQDGKLNKETGLPLFSSYSELQKLNQILSINNCVLIIKLHPFQDSNVLKCDGLSNITILTNKMVLEKDIQVNQLLANADALISDYSSVAVDYIMLDRPMAFIIEDELDYANTRGFEFENIIDYLPGSLIHNVEELFRFVKEVANEIDLSKDTRQQLASLLNEFNDGNSSKRLLKSLGIIK